MNKKQYIERAKNVILNRVRFHAPVVYDDHIDKTVLFRNGVDVDKPIFKFDKALNKHLAKAFELAQKEEEFNLLLASTSLGKMKEENLKIKNLVVYSKQASPVAFVEMINKLNINYQSNSNYNLVFKDKFFKVNGCVLNPHFDDFCLCQKGNFDDVCVDYKEFVLNGNNFFVEFKNQSQGSKTVDIEFNFPLKKAYYYFKRLNRAVLIENLMTKEKFYLNFVCRNAKFSFSNVDGLENSVFCCVNVKVSFKLSSKEEKFVFFNIGDSKFSLTSKEQIKDFQTLARTKTCEIFNVQVKTKNPKFDLFFNKKLPQKIWTNWLNNDVDISLEEKYLSLKRLFVKGTEKISFVPFKEIGLREIGVFNGQYYKKIVVILSAERFIRVGKTFFYNINNITNFSLQSKEPIVLSFGE